MTGKVKSVERSSSSTLDALHFGYGTGGHRIMKQVTDDPDLGTGYREHYIRDAQCLSRPSGSNIMATYRYSMPEVESVPTRTFELTERPLYGSSRLGSYKRRLGLYDADYLDDRGIAPALQADLHYELSDHLGNVTTVVSGRLLPGNGGGTLKQAEVLSAQGFEAYGSLLPGRNFNSGSYRHLFQGQEHDDEINGGVGTSYAYTFRMHDPRIGRFLSIDPLAGKYPHWSPYAFAGNQVISTPELEGLEPLVDASEASRQSTLSDESDRGYKPWLANMLVQNWRVREKYLSTKAPLKDLTPENILRRDQIRAKLRSETPQPFRAYLDNIRPASAEASRPKTNPSGGSQKANIQARSGGAAGGALLLYGAYQSAETVANSDNPIVEGATELSGWAAGISLGTAGAEMGAAAGPWGALAGGLIFGTVGFVGGKEAGSWLLAPPNADNQISGSMIKWKRLTTSESTNVQQAPQCTPDASCP